MTYTSTLNTVEPPISWSAELKNGFEASLVKVWCLKDFPFQDQHRKIGVKRAPIT